MLIHNKRWVKENQYSKNIMNSSYISREMIHVITGKLGVRLVATNALKHFIGLADKIQIAVGTAAQALDITPFDN